MLRLATVLVLAACPVLASCSSAAPESGSQTTWSDSGAFLGTFDFDPSPPSVGKNRLDAQIANDERTLVSGAAISVETWMPAHGHGSASDAQVSETGDGFYRIEGVVYEMPGDWVLRIQVRANATQDVFELPVAVR